MLDTNGELSIIAALDTGSSFEGMRASREVQFAALAEPACILGEASVFQVRHGAYDVLRSVIMKTSKLLWLAVCLVLTSCASGRRSTVDSANWDARVGSYTYDQAVAELGKPDVQVVSSEGRTAEWVLQKSPNVSFGFGMGTGSYGTHSGVGVGAGTAVSPPPSGDYLSLNFAKDGTLTSWSRIRY